MVLEGVELPLDALGLRVGADALREEPALLLRLELRLLEGRPLHDALPELIHHLGPRQGVAVSRAEGERSSPR